MKLLPTLFVSSAALTALVLTPVGATAADATVTSCPAGQTMVDGKCTAPDAVNYNSSKSNTGNVTVSPNSKNISDGAAKGQADE